MNCFSALLSARSTPPVSREIELAERSNETTDAPANVSSFKASTLLLSSRSSWRWSPSNPECGNSSILFICRLRLRSFVRPRNAAESILSILFELSFSVSSAGRFSKAPRPSSRSLPLSISSVRRTGSNGNVCVDDIETTLL